MIFVTKLPTGAPSPAPTPPTPSPKSMATRLGEARTLAGPTALAGHAEGFLSCDGGPSPPLSSPAEPF